jgi:signal transduction histidine kinase
VRDEAAEMLGVPLTILLRYDDREATVLATSDSEAFGPVGTRWPLEGKGVSVLVHRTGKAARIDATKASSVSRSAGVRWTVGVPIEVEGRLWGVMAAGSREVEPLPPNTEVRLAKFTQLLATAIANAENRAELDASRARIVTTADATRRRIERDLHDGAQQQLVSLALQLRAVQATVPEEFEQHRSELSQVVEGLVGVLDDLREIALGIHPAALSEGGLVPALKTLARRSPIPVEVDIRLDARLPDTVEVTAYYVVSEALTNAAKHARASRVEVAAAVDGDVLRISVRDDGRGGADPGGGSGLVGLRDRVEAIRGTMRLRSPAGGGTLLSATLPLDDGLR